MVIKSRYGLQDDIKNVPILAGHLLFTEVGRLYIDRPDGTGRIEISNTRLVKSELERIAIMTPVDGFYYVTDTGKLYRYHAAQWYCINEEPVYVGADGKIMSDYLTGYGSADGWPGATPESPGAPGKPGQPGDVVLLGPGGVVPEGYQAIATATRKGIARLGADGGAARYGNAADVGLGKVMNAAQVKTSDIETSQPTSESEHSSVTSSKQLYRIIGGTTDELLTESKSLIGAINELQKIINNL